MNFSKKLLSYSFFDAPQSYFFNLYEKALRIYVVHLFINTYYVVGIVKILQTLGKEKYFLNAHTESQTILKLGRHDSVCLSSFFRL